MEGKINISDEIYFIITSHLNSIENISNSKKKMICPNEYLVNINMRVLLKLTLLVIIVDGISSKTSELIVI